MKLPTHSFFRRKTTDVDDFFCLGAARETHRGGTGAFCIRGNLLRVAESKSSFCVQISRFCISEAFLSSMVNLVFVFLQGPTQSNKWLPLQILLRLHCERKTRHPDSLRVLLG